VTEGHAPLPSGERSFSFYADLNGFLAAKRNVPLRFRKKLHAFLCKLGLSAWSLKSFVECINPALPDTRSSVRPVRLDRHCATEQATNQQEKSHRYNPKCDWHPLCHPSEPSVFRFDSIFVDQSCDDAGQKDRKGWPEDFQQGCSKQRLIPSIDEAIHTQGDCSRRKNRNGHYWVSPDRSGIFLSFDFHFLSPKIATHAGSI
jgi:hypothetical protein